MIERDPDQRFLTARTVQQSVEFIQRHQAQPFFCYIPLSMPHSQLAASPRFRGKSLGGLYGDVIEEIDWGVGKVLEAVDRFQLAERTIILFTSDNGGVLASIDSDHGRGSCGPLRGSKGTTWEGGHRVPFIIRWPGKVPAGSECREMTLSMDILPTLARLIGTKEPEDRIIDGRDALALWLGEPGARTPHEAYFYYSNEELHAVRSGDWKLHVQHPDWRSQRLAAAREDLGDSSDERFLGSRLRPVGEGTTPPAPFLPNAVTRLEHDSHEYSKLIAALHAATPVAYKMRDWQWAEVDGVPLSLDAWWPRGSGPWPILVWVHGQHAGRGFKEMLENRARQLAAAGYACLCIQYRQPHSDDNLADAIEDCLGAVLWAQREAARVHGDPHKIVLLGESSAGPLVS